ncbi:MAG: hypothetical protein KDK27_18630 [Leptospiraceae bacterium]|nr:hypothetical protein [Leptospiraceae bacterium]
MVLEEIKPRVRNLVNSNIDFSMLNLLETGKGHDNDTYLEEVWNFYEKTLQIPEVRLNLDAFGRLIESRMVDTYVMTAGTNRSYTYTELFKVDRIRLKTEEYIEVMKVMFFLRPFVYIPVPVDPSNVKRGAMTLAEVKRSPSQLKTFCENLRQMLISSLPAYPTQVIDAVIDSCQDWEENPSLSAAGRFLNIFSTRARDLRLNQKVAKGAETPDKSWFSVSIRNARYLGQDKRMLEDLNAIAFELRR